MEENEKARGTNMETENNGGEDGFGEVGKKGWIHSLIKDECLDIIGIQETKCGVVDDMWVEDIWGGRGFRFTQLAANENLGGIILIWDTRSFTYRGGMGDERFAMVKGDWKGKGQDVYLACVYGPHMSRQKTSLWERLIREEKGAWCIFGDLNVVRDVALDRKLSDHCPIVLKDVDLDFGPRPFWAFDIWIEEKDTEQVVDGAWKMDLDMSKEEAMSWELEAEKRTLNDNERATWMKARKTWNNKTNIRGKMVRHFKKLFSEGVSVRSIFYYDRVEKISLDDAITLEKEFFEGEIVDAIMGCGGGGIKIRVRMASTSYISGSFWTSSSPIWFVLLNWFGDWMEISKGCNTSFVTIIPKVTDPIGLGDFHPISLIGRYYKIIVNILAEKVKKVVGKVVGDVQNC
ncbi:RNA-directed DNA polymerase, eukaryota [Tanacetum coccineum]